MDSREIDLARRVAWWKEPAEVLAARRDFLARVMVHGTWEDWCAQSEVDGEEAFREALIEAAPGVFDPRSWAYWRLRLGLPEAALPQRRL